MLNAFLHRALEAVFHDVTVANEGEHAEVERVQGPYTTSWRIREGGPRGEQYIVRCPCCGDRKGHLYISYLSYARPVVDGAELAVGPLLAKCFRRDCMADRSKREVVESRIATGMACVGDGMETSSSVVVPGSWQAEEPADAPGPPTLERIRSWLPGFNWCTEGMPPDVEEYLAQRGVSSRDTEMFRIGWGPVTLPRSGKMLLGGLPHVLFPVWMNNALRGIQARCLDKYLTGDGLRYWLHPGMRKSTVVYNLDNARDCGMAVVCEGVFDVISVGRPGVCLFGHKPSATQKALLSTVGKGLVWLPDTDVRPDLDTVAKAREQCAEWNADRVFPLGAHVVVLPAKDAGEMSRQAIWECIFSQVTQDMQEFLMSRVVGML